MDLEALRASVADLDFSLMGVTATLTPPYENPIEANIIWLQNRYEDQPIGRDYSRRAPRRMIAIRRNGFSEVPRETVVLAVEKLGETATEWQVDGIEEVTRTHFIVFVVPRTHV